MTENENSPENLRKFLESDDPAMVMMGLSMAKGSGFSEKLTPILLNLYMWNDDKNIRASAKSVFNKYSPLDIQNEVNKLWKPNYRTLSTKKDKLINIIGKLLKSHEYIARASISPILRYHDEDDEYHYLLRKLSQSPERKHLLQSLTKTFYEKSEEIRFQTVSAMHKIRGERDLMTGFLIKALDDNSEKIRVKASWALGDGYSSNKMKNINPLLKALKDKNIKVRENIIRAIGVFGKKSDAKHLLEFLEHKNKKIRSNAIKSLESIGSNIAAEPLINLLKKLYEESESTGPYHWGYDNPLAQVCRAIGNSIKGKNIDQLLNLLKPPLHNFEDVDSDSISLTKEILTFLSYNIGNRKALIEFTKIVEKIKNNPKIVWGELYHNFCCFDETALALVTVIKIAPQEYQERAYNELGVSYTGVTGYHLKDFLKENKMKTSGNKKDLIERINKRFCSYIEPQKNRSGYSDEVK
tara:strand:+ start:351 stop:1754 length:1404 start_codon:yes stop_codon:yes gene_type:complete